ncbi:GspH/FimT family pseudopilin [Marinobacterium lutimaris]|uniref:Type II secretion system protein H n=1 Tax=Marinobacterium lutimaris TaxID=568106 RepID=A0A1H6CVR6_9GAMM|nr:GspH/FimT family pseudopilin [Marinobacterium lutimaris]SEG76938.1 type IV fimbrial biogenesis protein FimT [Marinobacterium lutimaris]
MYLQRFTAKTISTRQQGVTFIELLISIAVLAILVALAAPYFGNYIERQRLVGATEALHGQIQQAKRAAISNNKTIFFNVTTGQAWVSVYGDQNPPASQVNGEPVLTVSADEYPTIEVSNAGSNATVSFEKPGLGTAGTIVSDGLRIESPSAWQVVVSVSSVGQVEICSDDVSQYPACP